MRLTLDKIGALAFLAFAIAYGSLINNIPLFPGDEDLPFNARTMPTVLAWAMAVIAFLMLILPAKIGSQPESAGGQQTISAVFKGLNWGQTSALIALMVFYGLTLPILGFIPATILFLMGGIRLMGEKRWLIILVSAIPLTLAFWVILDQLLGIFLSPGDIFYWIEDML